MFDKISIWDVPPISIEEFSNQNIELVVFPNPANDILNIKLLTKDVMPRTINLYNYKGVLFDELTINSLTAGIDISNYPIGLHHYSSRRRTNNQSTRFFFKGII